MSEPQYTQREVMDFHFKRLDEKLDDIRATLRDQNVNSDIRFKEIEKDVDALKTFQTRALTIWAIVTTAISVGISKWFL
jgi:hypothetical protein